ncbi:phytanoyl-CoA dioxygenase family protein [Sphingomonas aerolata]|uniref:phytanoyl-CoA dioxygenase family protein n=2 Tax=Sphingomonadaceae TaxID=41297 RepID=UPI00335C0AC2
MVQSASYSLWIGTATFHHFRPFRFRPTADIAKAHRLGLADAVMMHDQSRLTFSDHGAELFAGALAGSLADLRAALAHLPSEQAGIRIRGIEALRPFLACGGAIGSIAANVLGQRCRPVRAIFFDKTAETNWSLAWHQDRTICVQRRIDMDGFGPWTIKGGMQHVAPPFDLLTRMVTLRAHLDDVPATNAPLLIAPGSHAEGRVPVDVIEQVVSKCGTRVCTADAGDLWLYATPILHASEAASRPAHRRVLQIDFSADELPGGLEWLGV